MVMSNGKCWILSLYLHLSIIKVNTAIFAHMINSRCLYVYINSFLLLIAWKVYFDSSRCFAFFHCNMARNDRAPFCTRNLFLKSVYKGQTKRKWSSFSATSEQNTQFLFVGQSLYLYMLLFIGRTPSLSRARAFLTQNISMSDKYLPASIFFFFFLKQRYTTFHSLSLMSAVHSWVNMSKSLRLKTHKNGLTSSTPCCNHTK